MKQKKLISLIFSIILLLIISPSSFAVPSATIGTGANEGTYAINLGDYYADDFGDGSVRLEAFNLNVVQDGLYQTGVTQGGGVPVQFIILEKRKDASGNISLVPVNTSVYVERGVDGSVVESYRYSQMNNTDNRSTSVALSKDKEYMVAVIGDHGQPAYLDRSVKSDYLEFSATYVPQPTGMELAETNTLATEFSCPVFGETGTLYVDTDENNTVVVEKKNESTTPPSEGGEENETPEDNESQEGQVTEEELQGVDEGLLPQPENPNDINLNEHENSAFEKFITWFLVKGIGDTFRAALIEAFGPNISIDSLLFNEYSNTRLSIFSSSRGSDDVSNSFLEGSGLLDDSSGEGVITKYFVFFRDIALACYIVILLYMGVRILLASTGSKKEKYKSMALDWVKGIIILSFFPTVMKYTIVANNGIVSYVSEMKMELNRKNISNISLPTLSGVSQIEASEMGIMHSDTANNGDIMQLMRAYALTTGRIAYAMLYLFLLKELVGFIYIYCKRLLLVIFLMVIFPLVTISYAVDKIGDGKSQAFNHWFKEFLLNVFLQSFQAINYLVIMSVIFALTASGGTVNVILVLIALEFLSKGDELLRGMFTMMEGGGAGSTPRSLSEAVKTMATFKLVTDLGKQITSVGNRLTNFTGSLEQVRTSYQNLELAKINEREVKQREEEYRYQYSPTNPENVAINDVGNNIAMALSLTGSPEDVKAALDRLAIARNDPNRRALFEAEYSSLSEAEKEKLNKLMGANEAINATINGNVGTNGKLTNREINLNFTIITDILEEGVSGDYRALYKYIDSKELLDDSGRSTGTLKSAFRSMQQGRVMNLDEQRVFKKAQNFVGGASGLNDSMRVMASTNPRTGRLQGARDGSGMDLSRKRTIETGRVYTMTRDEKASLGSESRRILTSVGASGARATAAADTIAVMKEYSRRISEGTQDGVSANEAMELATNLRRLHDESRRDGDVDTQNVLRQLETEVGFNVEQFETVASLAAINNYQSLEGNSAQQQEVLDEAYRIVRRVNETSNDNVAKAMINRSEIDRILDGEIDFGSRPVAAQMTVEEYRTKKGIAELRAELEREYDNSKKVILVDEATGRRYEFDNMTVKEAKAKLFKDLGKSTAAGLSLAKGTVLGAATGITASALYAGAAGDTNPIEVIGVADVGIRAEHSVESLIPGTQFAKDKKSVGNKIDTGINKSIEKNYGKTPEVRQNELDIKIAKNKSYQNKIESYKKYLR